MAHRISDLRQRDVININDGKRLGLVSDVDVDPETGRIIALIVPGPGRFLGFLGGASDYVIFWDRIVRIGPDVILVNWGTERGGGHPGGPGFGYPPGQQTGGMPPGFPGGAMGGGLGGPMGAGPGGPQGPLVIPGPAAMGPGYGGPGMPPGLGGPGGPPPGLPPGLKPGLSQGGPPGMPPGLAGMPGMPGMPGGPVPGGLLPDVESDQPARRRRRR